VLDNLKDYAVRALVNAVDHLGTVAYKLTDLLDQQALEISSTELHVTCLQQDPAEGPKPMTPFRSFDNPKPEKKRTPTRSKSLLSAFFVKQKSPKQAISLKGSA
ncbi:protein ABIL1 isoform X1, partial [Tanacetum coccineum]